jgi:thiosulfate reductase cytochrome b subunit
MTDSQRPDSDGRMYYRHSLPVRIMHWLIVLSLPILLMSGLNIFNAHQALYWGKSSYNGNAPILEIRSRENDDGELTGITRVFGHEFITTGFLGASSDRQGELEDRGFPSWLTLPGNQWLAMARRWHLFFAWLLAIASTGLVAHAIFSRHLQRDLLPTGKDWRSIGATFVDHVLFRHPTGEAARNYNVLQKLAYLTVIFLLLPLVILNGLGMSPGMDAFLAGWVDLFGGRQSMRTIHFIVSWLLVAFTAVHLFQVVVNGFWNNLRSMITGYYRIPPEKRHD